MDLPGNDKLARLAAEFMDRLESELAEYEDPQILGIGLVAETRYRRPGEDVDRNEVIVMCSEDGRVYQRGLFDEAYDRAVDGERTDDDEEE